MRLLILTLCCLFASCSTSPDGSPLQNYMLVYTGDSVEISNIQATGPSDVVGAGYNWKTKQAYMVFANGDRTNLKVVGGGFGGNTLSLVLEGGSRVSIDVRTGKVTTTAPQFSK